MEKFRFKIQDALKSRCTVGDGTSVLVALSGGADSVALLDVLVALGYECVVAHCNFHLRGEESNRDCDHAVALAESLGVEIHVKDFDVPAYEAQYRVSTEMACRELRYEWFEQLREAIGADVIAVAHHRDDNIETFFLNLLRGTGIAGLTGMAYRNDRIVRPMLDCTRVEIEQYLRDRHLDYVTDSTNLQNDFKRNRLRNVILPMIEEQFPGASDAIATTIANLKGNEAVYHSRISEIERKYKKENIIEVAQLVADEVGVETLLFELLRTYGFNATHVHDIVVSIGQSGKRFYSGRCVALLDRGRLILSDESQGYDSEEYIVDLSENIKSPIDLAVSIIENDGNLSLKADVNKVFFDAEILSCDAVFKLRHWQQGDRLAPFGMKGTKKLSDIFSDAKLSLDDKSRVWLLTRNDEIIWVLGIRSSRHFAVTDTTKRVLQIEILP